MDGINKIMHSIRKFSLFLLMHGRAVELALELVSNERAIEQNRE